jgi:transposase, IS605 OrfB family, central region
MQLRYNFRLYPDPGHRIALAQAFGCARVVFNDALTVRRLAFENGLPFVSDGDLSKLVITAAKNTPERVWLGEVSAVVLQQALADCVSAYRNFFASAGGRRKGPKISPPRYRSRRDNRQAIRFTRNARFAVTAGGKLRLPKIGDVPVRWSRPLPAEPSSVTVIKDAAGRYFASFVVGTDPEGDRGSRPVGPFEHRDRYRSGSHPFRGALRRHEGVRPGFFRRAQKRLRKAQRDLSRKAKGSKNRAKAVRKVARQHARTADARREFHHQLSTQIIRENQAVYVEDLAINGLARTRLAKSVHDAGWSAFVDMLEYKAARYGRYFGKIGRFEPTSQVCSTCGVKDGPKPLNIREWTCPACGTVLDRDVNASNNILAAGRADRLNACGGPVRPGAIPAQPVEPGSHRDDRARQPARSVVRIPGL